jgi:hypothetical protein
MKADWSDPGLQVRGAALRWKEVTLMTMKDMDQEEKSMKMSGEECCRELNDPCTCYYPVEPCEDGEFGCKLFMDPCCC